jgi:hypothetical protein
MARALDYWMQNVQPFRDVYLGQAQQLFLFGIQVEILVDDGTAVSGG